MPLFIALCIAAMLSSLLGTAQAQATAPSARAAALDYAIRHGLVVPRDSVVIAREAIFEMNSHHSRSPTLGSETLYSQAAQMAARLGADVPTSSSKSMLTCVQTDCATATRFTVVLVGESTEESYGTAVHVMVFHPAGRHHVSQRTAQSAVVVVRREGNGWVGVRNHLGPSPIHPVRIGG